MNSYLLYESIRVSLLLMALRTCAAAAADFSEKRRMATGLAREDSIPDIEECMASMCPCMSGGCITGDILPRSSKSGHVLIQCVELHADTVKRVTENVGSVVSTCTCTSLHLYISDKHTSCVVLRSLCDVTAG